MIDVDKDEVVPPMFDVSAMPTLVIANAKGEQLSKSVGAPFSTPEEAIKWFDEIGEKLTAFDGLLAKWDESKHTDVAVGKDFAEACVELGRIDDAILAYESLVGLAGDDKAEAASLHLELARIYKDKYEFEDAEKHAAKASEGTPETGDARVDLDLLRIELLLYTEKPADARQLCEKHREALLKAADERVIQLTQFYLGTEEGDESAINKKGRKLYVELAKTFDDHERVWELKTIAAWYALNGEDEATGIKELEEVAEKAEGRWKEIAKSVLDRNKGDDDSGDEGEEN